MGDKSAAKKRSPAGHRTLRAGKPSAAAKSIKLVKPRPAPAKNPLKPPKKAPVAKSAKPHKAPAAKPAIKTTAKPPARPTPAPASKPAPGKLAPLTKLAPMPARAPVPVPLPSRFGKATFPLADPPIGKPPPLPPRPIARPPPPKAKQITRSFYWSELRLGDDLPPLTKSPIDRLQIARYAGAANDFNRLQLDEPYAHALGFRGAFAPGALAMGFVGQLLTNWLKRGHVRRLSARFIKIIWPGDQLTCHGRVSELRKEKGACYADLELWAENQKGELVLRGQASCELYETPGSAPSAVGAPFSSDRPPAGAKSLPPRRK